MNKLNNIERRGEEDVSVVKFKVSFVVSNVVYFHPHLGKVPNLANMFQLGGNHQVAAKFEVRFLY